MSAILRTAAEDTVPGSSQLVRHIAAKPPLMEVWLKRLALLEKTRKLIEQAGVAWTPRGLLLTMSCGVLLAMALPLAEPALFPWPGMSAALAVFLAALPYLYLRRQRRRRLAAFEEQFPEALDFLARSMRAGHAFSISLEMIGEEIADPLGQEFRALFNEQNLGAALDTALLNFTMRVPLLDVRFFTSSVMLQKQTGGNLSEILSRLAYVIRERFRLKGQVKAASAHGRLTATILTMLPVATMVGLLAVAPGYLQAMAADDDGKWMIGGAIFAQILGNYCIKRIINIKV
jgi:tight adherence protein B